MCLGDIVEGENSQAELEEKVCAEGDEGPEWKDRNNLLLNLLREGNNLHKDHEVDRGQEHRNADGLLSARHDGGFDLKLTCRNEGIR